MILIKSYIVTNAAAASGGSSGTSIQFQDEGLNLGNNQADTVDFVGAGVTATRVLDKITVTIPGGGSVTLPFVTPEDYGAVGDGVTNDQAAFALAAASGLAVFCGAKTYIISSAVNLPDGARFFGCGNLTILKTAANVTIFNIQGQQCTISDITFQGDSSGSSQRGIAAVGNAGFTLNYISNRIHNCRFINFGSAGIYATNILGSSSGTNHEGAFTVSNSVFGGCTNGIFWDTRGEYNNVSNCKFYNGTTGIRNIAGNNAFVNCQITGNTTGVVMTAGTNDGHAPMVACLINHNTTNISITDIANNYTFLGCMIYSGNVTVVTSDGIKFDACEFGSVTTFTSTTNTELQIVNCRFQTNPTFTVTGNNPIFFNNTFEVSVPSIAETNTLIGSLFVNEVGTTTKVSIITYAAVALVDAASMDLTATKHTLSTSSSARTFTISYTGDDITIEITLSAVTSTLTFPSGSLCVSEGVASGDNTLVLNGVSGDKYIICSKKIGSVYYVVGKNFGQ